MVHPDVRKAMDAVRLPQVQEMMRRLAEHGLAIAVPHMHNDEGDFLPLPDDKVGMETGDRVSFIDKDDSLADNCTQVMWRWDGKVNAASYCYGCRKFGEDRHRSYPCNTKQSEQ